MMCSRTTIISSFVTMCLEMNDTLYLKIGSFFLDDPILYTLRLTCRWPHYPMCWICNSNEKGEEIPQGFKSFISLFLVSVSSQILIHVMAKVKGAGRKTIQNKRYRLTYWNISRFVVGWLLTAKLFHSRNEYYLL